MTLRAQGFLGATSRRGGVAAMLRRVGAVQLDTISVLARSHELVAYARLGAVSRQHIEQAYWHAAKPVAFEYWAHAACVLPIEQWPYFAFRRRALRARGIRWHQSHQETCEKVLARLRAEGPLTATQLGGAKGGGPWWDWSDVKIAVEWLLDTGDVICARRTGWRRVYDLPDRVLPSELLNGRAVRPRVPCLPGRGDRPGPGRSHAGRPGRISPAELPHQREIPAHAAGRRGRAEGGPDPGHDRGAGSGGLAGSFGLAGSLRARGALRARGTLRARGALRAGPTRRRSRRMASRSAAGTASRCSRRSTR